MPRPTLGKGLGALIQKKTDAGSETIRPVGSSRASLAKSAEPSEPQSSSEESSGVREVPAAAIAPSDLQPRRVFSDEELADLMDSIRQHGIIQPLILRRNPQDATRFELIAGERRWRAASKLGLEALPAIVREASDQEVLEMALIENLQREDLNPMEEAAGYVRLATDFKLKQEEIARRVGKNRASVANAMRLLDLHQDVQGLVSKRQLSVGHAKAILGLKEHEAQKTAAGLVLGKGLTVRATEKLVRDFHKAKRIRGTGQSLALPPLITAIQNRLQEHFATRVILRHSDKKGRIELEYYGNEDLQRLLECLGVNTEDI